MSERLLATAAAALLSLVAPWAQAGDTYVNFEVSHVHPIALTPSGAKLLAVNTPDALLEVFDVEADGSLTPDAAVPVGLEPVSVVPRTDAEAWVVNNLSDSVSIVDLGQRAIVKTLYVGDEPTDVAFAAGKAFVAVSQEDALWVYDLANLDAAPAVVPLFARDIRALAVSADGSTVYAVALESGNETTVVDANVIVDNTALLDPARLTALGLNDMACDGSPPPYPPLPPGITRDPALTDPPSGVPEVALIVRWNGTSGQWEDEAGQDWSHCLPFRLPDQDLFAIDAATLGVTPVAHVGTSLFDVSVHPGNGKIYVPNTDARNAVRFEHPLGVQGHVVNNRLSVADPANGYSLTFIDLNTHIDRGSDPATNHAERDASISQPGMLAWNADGSVGYLTAIGSRKLFKLDGTCLDGGCVFGASRASPAAVETGEGPTGVALAESKNRAYVLNRFQNSIAIVDTSTLTKIDELALHDPSSDVVKQGRRFLYDAILTSGHGDAACSSCHISGDKDGLAWDLGNPEGAFVPYGTPGDNVRFVTPGENGPEDCDPSICADHAGFDPQKGPMTTQTLRAMIEPLHWRGDRATMAAFNGAFVELMGAASGLTQGDMDLFRDFALEIQFPPNPHRTVDDTLPDQVVMIPGHTVSGNPASGAQLFDTLSTGPCIGCHASVFGTAGGKLGGIEPGDPTSDYAGLIKGDADRSRHSDIKVPQLRNMYEKFGPLFGDHVSPPPESKSGFGFRHDGSLPDLATFLSINAFTISPDQVRDLSTFVLHFPTGTKPAVGRQVTLPAGTPPTGSSEDEALLTTLISLGDVSDGNRHCELVATAIDGARPRSYRLSGGAWITDLASEAPVGTTALREGAESPITFTCVPLTSGPRLGGDRDEDAVLNGDDCAPGDPDTWSVPGPVSDLTLGKQGATQLSWSDQSVLTGPSLRYDLLGGDLSVLLASGPAALSCQAGDLGDTSYADARADPPVGDGYVYLIRASNPCGVGDLGAGRETLESLDCP